CLDPLDDGRGGAVTLAIAVLDDAGVSAVTLSEARCDLFDELAEGLLGTDALHGTPQRGEVAFLPEGDHPIGKPSQLFCLGLSGLNSLMDDQRGDQVPEHGL